MSSDQQQYERDLNSCLQSQNYVIKNELKVQNKLETHTGWRWDFSQAERYDFDLQVFRWDDNPTCREEDRELVGYVEIECAENWISGGFPENWSFLSFLRRKVHDYDHGSNEWGEVKNDLPTIYLKFSREMDGCFMAPISAIDRDGERTWRSDGTYDNTYLKLPYGHPKIRYGIENTVDYLTETFQ